MQARGSRGSDGLTENEAAQPLRDRRSFARLTPLAQAVSGLIACCPEVAPTQIRIEAALDLILAAAVRAPAAIPSRKIALIDGWAVTAEDTLGASTYAPGFPAEAPVRVIFGDAVPEGKDAVLPEQAVAEGLLSFEILSSAAPGEGLRATAGDFSAGEIIVPAGARLRAHDVALVRLAGVAEVSARVPRLRVLSRRSTGDWLSALAAREGARVEAIDFDAEGLTEALLRPGADLVFVSASGDQAAPIIAAIGDLLAHGVAIRPGETMGCGMLRSGLGADCAQVIFTPERPECVLSAWLLLCRPCLRARAGAIAPIHGEALPLTRKIVSDPGMSDLTLLRRIDSGGAPNSGGPSNSSGHSWEPLAVGDIAWSALARADAWLLVPPESEGYAAGQSIFAYYL
jgi:molybdopterin molybdotransferase